MHYKTRSTRMVSDMINNPVKQLPIINLTSRQTDTQLDQFIICTIRQKAVHFQKCQHNQNADSFIAIDKCMVINQRKPQSCGFGGNRFVQIFAPETLEGCI